MGQKTKLPAVTNRLNDSFARAVAELIGVWKGERGDKLDRVLTLRDLTESNLIQSTSAGGISTIPPDDGIFTPIPDPTIPTKPTNFTVSAGVLKVIVSWDVNTATNHAHTEIWRNSVDNLGTAVKVGQTGAAVYTDNIDQGDVVYYWARHVNTTGLPGPYNATPGTSSEAGRVLVGALPVQWTNVANLTVDNVTGGVIKTGGTGGWNAAAASTAAVADGDAFFQFSTGDVSAIQGMAGLGSDNTITSYLDTDFVLFTNGATNYQVYESGVFVATIAGITPADGDTLSVSIEGLDVVYRVNGSVVRTTVAPTITYPIYTQVAVNTIGGEYESMVWDRGNPGVYGVILAGNISNGAVTGLQLANLAVDTAALADAAITTAKIGNAQINPPKISDSIQSDDYSASGTYAGWKIQTRSGSGEILANKLTIRNSAGTILLSTGANLSSAFIHSANKVTNTNIGTYMASAAIKTAYIENLAVTTGKIKDLAVDTLKIAGKAVTVPGSAGFTSFKGLSSGSWTTLASVTVNAGTTGALVDSFFAIYNGEFTDGGAAADIYLEIQYDGGTQETVTINVNGAQGGVIAWVKDSPTSGNHTFLVRAKCSSGSNRRAESGALFAIGTKK